LLLASAARMGQLGYTYSDQRSKAIAHFDLKSWKQSCHEERQFLKAL